MAITVLQVCNAQRNNVKFFTQIMLPYIRVFSSDCQQALVQSRWDWQCLVHATTWDSGSWILVLFRLL